jgi:hypothetical protein
MFRSVVGYPDASVCHGTPNRDRTVMRHRPDPNRPTGNLPPLFYDPRFDGITLLTAMTRTTVEVINGHMDGFGKSLTLSQVTVDAGNLFDPRHFPRDGRTGHDHRQSPQHPPQPSTRFPA